LTENVAAAPNFATLAKAAPAQPDGLSRRLRARPSLQAVEPVRYDLHGQCEGADADEAYGQKAEDDVHEREWSMFCVSRRDETFGVCAGNPHNFFANAVLRKKVPRPR